MKSRHPRHCWNAGRSLNHHGHSISVHAYQGACHSCTHACLHDMRTSFLAKCSCFLACSAAAASRAANLECSSRYIGDCFSGISTLAGGAAARLDLAAILAFSSDVLSLAATLSCLLLGSMLWKPGELVDGSMGGGSYKRSYFTAIDTDVKGVSLVDVLC